MAANEHEFIKPLREKFVPFAATIFVAAGSVAMILSLLPWLHPAIRKVD